MRVNFRKLAIVLATATITLGAARVAAAQGKSHGHAKANDKANDKVPPGQAKKMASSDDGVRVTREILVAHGFQVVRVERLGGDRVIYYRRGNMGRGRGLGPVVKMYVRQPAPDRVVFDMTPREVLAEIKARMAQ